MNELTREASKQTPLERISFLWLGGRGRTRKLLKTSNKPLKHDFLRYTTTVYGSGCEVLEDWDINILPFKYKGVDLDRFKRECEEIDRG